MSAEEINIFERIWKLIWDFIYAIAEKMGWKISNPYDTTAAE